MAYSHVITQNLQAGNIGIGGSKTYSAPGRGPCLNAVTVGSEQNIQHLLEGYVSLFVSVVIVSDKDVTLFTNASDGDGGNTISLFANVPFIWNTDSPFANPFTTNITQIWIRNDGASTATVSMETIVNVID